MGNIIIGASSLLCALSPSGAVLISLRAIQGLGSAMVFGTGIAIITSVYPPNERGKAIGVTVTSVYIGLSLAPFLGGILTQYLGW
jgi:MFS family permease